MAAFRLADVPAVGGLSCAIRMVPRPPVEATCVADRGAIARACATTWCGYATDDSEPVVRALGREGPRAASDDTAAASAAQSVTVSA